MTAAQTDRDRFESGETLVVWGEQCHGMAGRRAYDADRIFDDHGDLTADFDQYDITLDQFCLIERKGGSYWCRVQSLLEEELASKGLIEEEEEAEEEEEDE